MDMDMDMDMHPLTSKFKAVSASSSVATMNDFDDDDDDDDYSNGNSNSGNGNHAEEQPVSGSNGNNNDHDEYDADDMSMRYADSSHTPDTHNNGRDDGRDDNDGDNDHSDDDESINSLEGFERHTSRARIVKFASTPTTTTNTTNNNNNVKFDADIDRSGHEDMHNTPNPSPPSSGNYAVMTKGKTGKKGKSKSKSKKTKGSSKSKKQQKQHDAWMDDSSMRSQQRGGMWGWDDSSVRSISQRTGHSAALSASTVAQRYHGGGGGGGGGFGVSMDDSSIRSVSRRTMNPIIFTNDSVRSISLRTALREASSATDNSVRSMSQRAGGLTRSDSMPSLASYSVASMSNNTQFSTSSGKFVDYCSDVDEDDDNDDDGGNGKGNQHSNDDDSDDSDDDDDVDFHDDLRTRRPMQFNIQLDSFASTHLPRSSDEDNDDTARTLSRRMSMPSTYESNRGNNSISPIRQALARSLSISGGTATPPPPPPRIYNYTNDQLQMIEKNEVHPTYVLKTRSQEARWQTASPKITKRSSDGPCRSTALKSRSKPHHHQHESGLSVPKRRFSDPVQQQQQDQQQQQHNNRGVGRHSSSVLPSPPPPSSKSSSPSFDHPPMQPRKSGSPAAAM